MKSHNRHGQIPATKGFSLLEILVVLALVSLLGALALPNLAGLYDSVTRATERDQILDQFAGIGREALFSGQGYAVYGTASEPPPVSATDWRFETYPLIIPEGWQVELDRPLRVRPSGVCLGATVTLRHADAEPFEVVLAAPYCRVETDA